MVGVTVSLSASSPRRKPGPITTNVCVERRWSHGSPQQQRPGVMGPGFRRDDNANAGATTLIIALRRRDEAAVMRRADQDLVDADPRRQTRDEGDGAAAIFRLQHFCLLGLARRH